MPLVHLRKSSSSSPRDLGRFLPTTREEMAARGWAELDVLLVNGDAYVDHPAFGGAHDKNTLDDTFSGHTHWPSSHGVPAARKPPKNPRPRKVAAAGVTSASARSVVAASMDEAVP